jgi:biopolymer transport protein ExbB
MWRFLIEGGPIMVPMVLTSIVALAFIIERGLALRRNKVIPLAVQEALERCQTVDDIEGLQTACRQSPATFSRLLAAAAEHLPWPKTENSDALQTEARHEVVQLERGLVVLEIVVGIAPLLGLVGTLHGLIRLFGGLGNPGLADNARIASGIAETLNTTFMGLMIAIPALVAWSYYNKKVENLAIEMESLLEKFLRHQYRRKKKA